LLFLTPDATLPIEPAGPVCVGFTVTKRVSQESVLSQESVMSAVHRLPSRFPVGTRYVIEGQPNQNGELQITSRYLVLPNGTHLDLRVDDNTGPEGMRRVRVRRTRSYKTHATRRWLATPH
jgi:hypothetical protein